ncbi:MAG: hypothetical protein IJP72_01145 [Bacteroidales bacterium]|nr:hypothetical protein [Bacteroidales bacterium]
MRRLALFLLLLTAASVQAQVEKATQDSAKRIFKEGIMNGYKYIPERRDGKCHLALFPVQSDLLNDWTGTMDPMSISFNGEVKSVREVRHNFQLIPNHYISEEHLLKRHNNLRCYEHLWESRPIEEWTYSFDSLHRVTQLDARTITMKQYRRISNRFARKHHGNLYVRTPQRNLPKGLWKLAYKEEKDRYLVADGRLQAWQRQAKEGHWYYMESLQYDSCGQVCTVFQFENAFLQAIHSYTYRNGSMTSEREYDFSGKGLMYTIPRFPKNHERYLRYETANVIGDDTLPATLPYHYEYDSDGKLLSISSETGIMQITSNHYYKGEYFTGSLAYNVVSVRFEYDDAGNRTRVEFYDVNSDSTPIDPVLTWKFQYDTHGNWTECEEFSNEKLLSRTVWTITYGE